MTRQHPDQRGRRGNRTANTDSGVGRHRRTIRRRDYLYGIGTVGSTALTGCLHSESANGETPDPVSLGGTKQCDVCGMTIAAHPGPTGQIFYRDQTPRGHDNPAVFDSVRSCLFTYYFEHRRRDWTAEVVYVSDYSAIDYELSETEGQLYIESVTAADYFVDADSVVFVIDSDVHGAMERAFVPFSNADDAAAFAETHGGRTVSMDDVTPALILR